MMVAPFTVDEDAIRKLVADPMMAAPLTRAAEAITSRAEELAPDHTGRNKRSYKTRPAAVEDGTQRAYAYSDDPFDHLIEFGSANNPPYRPLTRAAQEVVGNFEDPGRK